VRWALLPRRWKALRILSAIYENLAAVLARLPASTGELCEATGLSRKTAGNYLRELCAAGIVARAGFRQREGRVYVRADATAFQRAGWRYEARGLYCFIAAWHALRARQTTDSLARTLAVHRRTASAIVRSLRDQGLVSVCAWEMRGTNLTAVYDRLPRQQPVPRPGRVPRTVSNAAYWARRRDGLVQGAAP
jgi:predicted transcriptional regulator